MRFDSQNDNFNASNLHILEADRVVAVYKYASRVRKEREHTKRCHQTCSNIDL